MESPDSWIQTPLLLPRLMNLFPTSSLDDLFPISSLDDLFPTSSLDDLFESSGVTGVGKETFLLYSVPE